jgi:hypothetical protein
MVPLAYPDDEHGGLAGKILEHFPDSKKAEGR